MKWIWTCIVDDDGKPVEEEVSEAEYAKRTQEHDRLVQCLRDSMKAQSRRLDRLMGAGSESKIPEKTS